MSSGIELVPASVLDTGGGALRGRIADESPLRWRLRSCLIGGVEYCRDTDEVDGVSR